MSLEALAQTCGDLGEFQRKKAGVLEVLGFRV